MKRIYLILLILNSQFSILNSLFAQDENAAFYIYQNDGHFDGFFYDEVLKMSYSKIDTAGLEYDVYVTQEIVTADSTYRIMLSAIDSVGFVQPEMKMNPNLHEVNVEGYLIDFDMIEVEYQYWDTYQLVFRMPDVDMFPDGFREAFAEEIKKNIPKEGNIYVCHGEYGWAQKIKTVEKVDDNTYQAICEDITDIGEIFTQFVGIEQYGFDDNGQMVRRRVAGHPELNIGRPLRKASSGGWEGDLFNFNLGGHYALYNKDDLYIGIDPSIEGKLHVKAAWNLSLFGDKYIGIESRLNFGVGCGFSIDGKISDFFPGGIGGLVGGVPIPATTPLIYLDIAPDMFLRGEAHVKFSASSPRLQGAMWSKLEIKNWVPSIGIGFGNPDGEKFESVDVSSKGLSLELSGFVQGGMLFPMKFKSLPILKKVFNASIGGNWFVGPKLAASFALDLTTAPWDDVATYNQLRNTKISLHMLDADYEVKADVETLFSGKQNVTLADGSISLFPPFDAALVPEFKEAVDYYEERWLKGWEKPCLCRIIAFEPTGYVVKLNPIGVAVADISKDETPSYVIPPMTKSYYHFAKLFGQQLPRDMWAEYVIPMPEDEDVWGGVQESYKYIIRPAVKLIDNQVGFVADPEIKILHGVEATVSSDTLWLNHDLTDAVPIKVLGDVDVPDFDEFSAIKATKIDGGYEIGRGPGFNRGKNYSPCDTLEYYTTESHTVTGTFKDRKFRPLGLCDPRIVRIFTLPNTSNPIGVNVTFVEIPWDIDGYLSMRTIKYDDPGMTYNISRRGDNMGWDIVADWSSGEYSMHLSYTLVVTEKGRLRQDDERPQFAMKNVQMTYKRNFTEDETHTIKFTIDSWEFAMDYIGGHISKSIPATYIVRKPDGSTQTSTKQITICIDTIFKSIFE